MASEDTKFGLAYLDPDEAPVYLQKHAGKVLGVIGFGREVALPPMPCAPLAVAAPVLGGKHSSVEVWTSDEEATVCEHLGICGTRDGKALFGGLTLEQRPGETLEMLAEQAYMRIFGFIDHFGYRNLLRVWHYFPQINDDENGQERYRCFNVGRHAAFVANGRSISEEDVPAASALGSNSGSLTIYFMAGKQPGRAVENPRQVSAYHYPEKFGPKSPIFVRALAVTLGGQDCFFISGTASIVGFETLHHGDAEKQTEETLLNIRTLLQQGPHYDHAQGRMLLKVYVRHEHDLAMVQSRVQAEFGTACRAVYLHSNICRSDLLLEIEGAYFNDAR
ncbi:chorismate transformation enzyme, FkbO/Hyg5 family [Sideroxyarcus sp. TK5]